MKKKYLMILVVVLMTLALTACGSSSDSSSEGESQDSSQEQTKAAEEAVSPYAWLGMQDMPQCDYLDVLTTKHFIKESEEYIDGMSFVTEEVKAEDGIDSYKEDDYSKVWTIGGKVTSVNESTKTYMEYDASDIADSSKESLESAMKDGTNLYGRSFVTTGKEVIPIYGDLKGDTTEYEYYEYNYPETEASSDNEIIERYYMKDGDIFAIYTKTTMGDTVIAGTEIIKSMSGDIPEGTFDLPDLSGYEKTEL